MNSSIFPLFLSLIAGLSTVLGSVFIFLKIKKVGEFIVFSLSFSLGIMTLISIFDLIPSSFLTIINNYGMYFGFIIFIDALTQIGLLFHLDSFLFWNT